jgi:SusD family.
MKQLVIILFAVALSSCKKYLDKKSDTSLVVPSTLEDFQALMDRSATMNLITPSTGEASADDYFLLPDTYNAQSDLLKKIYTWVPRDYNYSNDWSNCYLSVYVANLCLERLPLVPKTASNESKWNYIKGAALFYRSYAFLNLVWLHGKAYDASTSDTDPGIVLRLSSDVNTQSVRASVKACYDTVIAHTKEAVQYLPDFAENVYRPSKVAAYALLARAYLSMRKYSEALQYADLCLGKQNYLIDFNGDPVINGSLSGTAPFKSYQFNGEIIFYSQMNRNTSLIFPAQARIDTLLYQQYDANDWRRTAFFRSIGGYVQFKGNYSGNANFHFSGLATDEMFLIRAECYAREGNVALAMADLNTLMQKRWKNSVPFPTFEALDADEALDLILTERRKELVMRGLRWIDIKRLNKEGRNIELTRVLPDGSVVKLLPNANYYALPLPKDIIDMTGIPQNEY